MKKVVLRLRSSSLPLVCGCGSSWRVGPIGSFRSRNGCTSQGSPEPEIVAPLAGDVARQMLGWLARSTGLNEDRWSEAQIGSWCRGLAGLVKTSVAEGDEGRGAVAGSMHRWEKGEDRNVQ